MKSGFTWGFSILFYISITLLAYLLLTESRQCLIFSLSIYSYYSSGIYMEGLRC